MKTSKEGINLIIHFEGLHDGDLSEIGLQPKECPAGIWTIGYGHALKGLDGKWLKGLKGFQTLQEIYPDYLTLTKGEAVNILINDLNRFEALVEDHIKIPLQQYEFDALVSHAYNTGGSENLFKLVNNGEHRNEKILKEWWTRTYITVNRKPSRGLIRRRIVEYNLFKTGELDFNAEV